MRPINLLCLSVLCTSLATTAQVLPSSNGACTVSPSGLEGCEWTTAVARLAGAKNEGGTPKLFVTHYKLAPGAPLKRPVEDYDNFVVALSSGELASGTKSPENLINVIAGSVLLLPREEVYLLRNVGKQSLELVLIEVRK